MLLFYSFDVVWDDRDSAFGELKDYKLLYFLQDDTIAIKVIKLPHLIYHKFLKENNIILCWDIILKYEFN